MIRTGGRAALLLISLAVNILALALIKIEPSPAQNPERLTVRLVKASVPLEENFDNVEKKERNFEETKSLKRRREERNVNGEREAKHQASPEKRDAFNEARTTDNPHGIESKEGKGESWGEAGDGLSGEIDGATDDGTLNGDAAGEEQRKPSEDEIKKALEDYRALLYSRIAKNKEYPAIARRLGHEGKVVVLFTLSRDGSLAFAQVDQSSGFSELDEAALSAVRKASPFPQFPKEISGESRSFRVSIVFELT